MRRFDEYQSLELVFGDAMKGHPVLFGGDFFWIEIF